MADELRIWALRGGNHVEVVQSVAGVEVLEDVLVHRPEACGSGRHR